jgi:hypothetical protein
MFLDSGRDAKILIINATLFIYRDYIVFVGTAEENEIKISANKI